MKKKELEEEVSKLKECLGKGKARIKKIEERWTLLRWALGGIAVCTSYLLLSWGLFILINLLPNVFEIQRIAKIRDGFVVGHKEIWHFVNGEPLVFYPIALLSYIGLTVFIWIVYVTFIKEQND